MKNTKFPKSLRRRIRSEKARIRKETSTPKEVEEKMEEMYGKITGKKKS